MNTRLIVATSTFFVASHVALLAADWNRFRGPNGSGVASGEAVPPLTWSDTENVKWKVPLPGPGSSSPVVSGDRVFVTYWTGYATGGEAQGRMEDLEIHLRCLDRGTGATKWDRAVKARLPEQSYDGMFANHGYASHTPVTDGERVYAFFGKTGVFAFDLEGKELWRREVGDGLDERGWGSSSSPVLTESGVIILASPESHSMFCLDKTTGTVVWKQEAEGFGSTWGTPVVVGRGEDELVVVGVPNEVWALNARTGKMRWYVDGVRGNAMTGSVVAVKDSILASGDRGGGTRRIKWEGTGSASEPQIVWTGKDGGNITTPLVYENRIYFLKSGIMNCRDFETGKEIYAERLPAPAGQDQGVAEGRGGGGLRGGRPGGAGGGGRRGGGGRFGNPDYASPVAAGGYLFQLTGRGETIVVKLGDTFEFMGRNSFASDRSNFTGTPAISDGQIFVRSYQHLYCLAK